MSAKRIKKILFIIPPNTISADSLRRIGEPMGVLYISSMLKQRGYDVEVFDASCEGYDRLEKKENYVTYGSSEADIRKRIRESCADIIGVTCMFSSRESDMLKVCGLIKDQDPAMPVVAGGLHPSLFPERILKAGLVDFVIIGEGELRLCNLLDDLNSGKNGFDFDGIAYKEADTIKVNPVVERIEDLSALPYPDRDLVNMERYIDIGIPFAPYALEKRVAQVLATRGCPNRCNFCAAVNFWGRKVRTRSVENIIGEMTLLKERYGVKEIQFVDDNLTANKPLAKELFKRMKGLDLKWCTPNGVMFNTIDGEMLSLMADSGAYQLSFGIESASLRVLKEIIHKNVRLDMVKGLIEEAHTHDISVHGMFIVGFPGETKEEVRQTLSFPFKAGFDSASFFIVSPLPGSEIYDECISKKYINAANTGVDFKSAKIEIPSDSPDYNFSTEELEELVDKTTREFNEHARILYPDKWEKKFRRFLADHKGYKKTIMGRVT
ncbi:B12-binding domain-containing radical SAM protein [Candidatus Omnitrophota bacterium]